MEDEPEEADLIVPAKEWVALLHAPQALVLNRAQLERLNSSKLQEETVPHQEAEKSLFALQESTEGKEEAHGDPQVLCSPAYIRQKVGL